MVVGFLRALPGVFSLNVTAVVKKQNKTKTVKLVKSLLKNCQIHVKRI